MNSNSKFYDLKVFMQKNIKIIIGTTISVMIILLTGVLFSIAMNGEEGLDYEYINDQLLPTIETTADVDNLSDSDQEMLTEYLDEESYSFRFYIYNEDSAFTDNVLLKEILLDEQLTQTASEQTNSQFLPTEERAISVSTVNGSEMLQVKIGTGNMEYNERISNFYYQFINEGNISLFDDKSIYFVDSEPIIFEELNNVEPIEELTFQQKLTTNIEVLVIVGLIAILGGLILGIFVSIIKESINKKIPSIYNFDLTHVETVVNLDSIPVKTTNDMNNIIIQAIVAENKSNKLILSEKNMEPHISGKLEDITSKSDNHYFINVKNIEEFQLDTVEEVVILIQIYGTSKQWFEKQIEQIKGLNSPVKVIRLPMESNIFKEDL